VGVALDTLRQFSGGSSNDEQVIKLTIAGATAFAASRRVFVVLPHHTGKQNYREQITDMYCGSGSAAIADNCRFVLLLQTTTWADIESKVQRTGQERGDPLVLRSTRGSMLVKEPPPMFFHRDGYFIGLVKGKTLTHNEQAEKKDRAILQAVRDGAQSKTAILAKTGGKKQTVLARIGELEDLDYLSNGSQSGSPKYVLTTKGANFLDHHP
jgi:RecA-family ATPase